MSRWGKCDFRQLEALQKKLEKLSKTDSRRFCEEAARELAARLLAKVIKRTPVGKKPKINGPKTMRVVGLKGKSRVFLTREGERLERYWSGYMGGTLRRGWTSKTQAEAEAGGGTKDAAAYAASLPVTKRGGAYEIEIINPVNYGLYVEYGHRQQPGRYVPALGKRLKAGWVNGRYMLTISEKELQAMMPGLLEKKLQQYLEECFGG